MGSKVIFPTIRQFVNENGDEMTFSLKAFPAPELPTGYRVFLNIRGDSDVNRTTAVVFTLGESVELFGLMADFYEDLEKQFGIAQ